MEEKPILEEVAKKVEFWRSSKKYRGEALPREIVDDIKALAKSHKRYHLAKAFKMSGATVNKVVDSRFCEKRKKNYSAEERLALCQEWRRSGVSMEKFCNTHKISRPTFYRWCHHLYPEPKKEPSSAWIPIIAKPKNVAEEGTISIELPLPNQGVARVKLLKSEAVAFLQEFYHAITALQ